MRPATQAVGSGVALRRFVAVQLVMIAAGMTLEEAAGFLGIPDLWHRASRRAANSLPSAAPGETTAANWSRASWQ
ncbi:hypothetical protein [Streptomyces sp. NPDC048665]|uniref:hypothetical protein n=1 Tax=Streptomyces sp. NPDC048665 TaxID=3155490 RepID=UPI003422C87C